MLTNPATYDGIPFAAPSRSGAVFNLASGAAVPAAFTTDDGWTVQIARGADVVVFGPPQPTFADALASSFAAAQQALDMFSVRGAADLLTADAENQHIVGWDEAGTSVVRLVSTSIFGASMGTPSVTVTNSAGEVKPSPEPVTTWHQSMRYYRQAQLSEDLFDSVRSMWLAVENLLDALRPQTPGESEGQWLKAALKAAEAHIDLARYLPSGSAKAPHNHAYEYFYDQLRVSIFHGKGSRGPQLPHDVAGMADLASRHERLTRLYVDLLGEMTGVRRPSSVITYAGFDMLTGGWENNPVVHITDDPAPFDREQTVPNPRGGRVVDVSAAREPTLERPGLKALLAAVDATELRELEAVRRVVLSLGGGLASCHVVDGELRLGGVDRFETQLSLRLKNWGTPRSFAGV